MAMMARTLGFFGKGLEMIQFVKISSLPETNKSPMKSPPSFLVNTIKMKDFLWRTVSLLRSVV